MRGKPGGLSLRAVLVEPRLRSRVVTSGGGRYASLVVIGARHHRYAYADYVTLEGHSSVRHEFLDGEIYAMAGGTPQHAALSAALIARLSALLPEGCRVYTSDLRVRVPATGLSTYPDGAVVCGRSERALDDELAVVNPRLLVEVTSPSSEEYDHGSKLEHYKNLPALSEVLIVSHGERKMVVHRRCNDGSWAVHEAGPDASITLASLGGELQVDEVYDAVDEG